MAVVGDMDEAKVLSPCPPIAVVVDAVDSLALDLLSSGTERDSYFQTKQKWSLCLGKRSEAYIPEGDCPVLSTF